MAGSDTTKEFPKKEIFIKSSKSGKYITFLPQSMNVFVSQDELSILEIALDLSLAINHSCGGNGTCGTCRVKVKSSLADLPSRNEIESELASDRGFEENERLACQTHAICGMIIEIPTDPI